MNCWPDVARKQATCYPLQIQRNVWENLVSFVLHFSKVSLPNINCFRSLKVCALVYNHEKEQFEVTSTKSTMKFDWLNFNSTTFFLICLLSHAHLHTLSLSHVCIHTLSRIVHIHTLSLSCVTHSFLHCTYTHSLSLTHTHTHTQSTHLCLYFSN